MHAILPAKQQSQLCTFKDSVDVNHSTSRDKNNPHWISLLRHVRQLNDKPVEIANFHLGNCVMAGMTNDGMLPKATGNTADAHLETTDANVA